MNELVVAAQPWLFLLMLIIQLATMRMLFRLSRAGDRRDRQIELLGQELADIAHNVRGLCEVQGMHASAIEGRYETLKKELREVDKRTAFAGGIAENAQALAEKAHELAVEAKRSIQGLERLARG